jgi:hypothetical protein
MKWSDSCTSCDKYKVSIENIIITQTEISVRATNFDSIARNACSEPRTHYAVWYFPNQEIYKIVIRAGIHRVLTIYTEIFGANAKTLSCPNLH